MVLLFSDLNRIVGVGIKNKKGFSITLKLKEIFRLKTCLVGK